MSHICMNKKSQFRKLLELFIYLLNAIILCTFFMGIFIYHIQFKMFFDFNQFKANKEFTLTYENRKELFIKKGLFILKKSGSNFPHNIRNEFLNLVFDLSEKYMIPTDDFMAICYNESRFCNTDKLGNLLKGGANEIGFLQLMSDTFNELVGDSYYSGCEYDILFITRLGFKHLANINHTISAISKDNLEIRQALAYNCGTSAVKEVITNDDIRLFNWYVYERKNRTSYATNILKVKEWIRNLNIEE